MTLIEKSVGGLTLAAAIFAGGAGWNQLNNRIEQVDAKIVAIQEKLGSTDCTAILGRQIEAIEAGNQKALEALERLSAQYRCVPDTESAASHDAGAWMGANVTEMQAAIENASLAEDLEAIDVLLNRND